MELEREGRPVTYSSITLGVDFPGLLPAVDGGRGGPRSSRGRECVSVCVCLGIKVASVFTSRLEWPFVLELSRGSQLGSCRAQGL